MCICEQLEQKSPYSIFFLSLVNNMQVENDYEKQREARILENKRLLASLGLDILDTPIETDQERKAKPARPTQKKIPTTAELRRSLRSEASPVKYDFYPSLSLEAIRKCTKKNRSENADSCHQCRTKSDLRKGFSIDQKLKTALANPKWRCPVCQGQCNCSRCRLKRGLVPFGNSWRIIRPSKDMADTDTDTDTDTNDNDNGNDNDDVDDDLITSRENNDKGKLKPRAAPIERKRRKTAIYDQKYTFSTKDFEEESLPRKTPQDVKVLIKSSVQLDRILEDKMTEMKIKMML
ncbi:hypothetical protein CLU79DRAFT_840486 [Phycomyces nitens]|nr:hypothetical protein CLU79DRAFT_840486 [Phycomyces nitens]